MTTATHRFAFLLAFVGLLALMLPAPSHAFRSTKQESFTDPDYIGFQPKVVMIGVMNANLDIREAIERQLTRDLERRGITVYRERDLFPPTREWDAVQRVEVAEKFGIEAGIIVGIGSSSYDVSQFGSQTWGSATATTFGSTTNVQGSATTVPFVSVKSSSSFSGVMIDVTNGRIAWTTDIFTKAGGLLFAGGKKDAKAAAKAVTKALVEKEHLPKK